ncbi:FAD binding domain-containing protein [Actinoplanes sp. RD1]|uniref:FAD binding domain-containing protein n=1 Tax=Actinoplanes sp. RD1 TaxID=3064538 RepID=UPI0027416C5C|nr:FAD binding domain-containing protein [Actinoplanes sp. RD1]
MEYLAATSPGEVTAALADGDTAVLAGGQSLVLDVTNGDLRPGRVVDINPVREFAFLTETGRVLRVGPLVRHRTFETDAVGGALGAMLRTIVRHIGHPPIRARGTMPGSLSYAHPAAEWPVLATILGAEIDLVSHRERRTVPAERFFTGPYATVRRPDELLAEVRLPLLPAGTGAGFAEHRPARAKFAETAAMAAVTVTGGVISAALVGLVNAGPCPVRARAAEKALCGAPFGDAAIRAAAEAAAEVDANLSGYPAPERRGKQQAVRTLTRRALTQAREGL